MRPEISSILQRLQAVRDKVERSRDTAGAAGREDREEELSEELEHIEEAIAQLEEIP